MELVDIVEPEEGDKWKLFGIFGDQKTVRGKIIGMNLVNHQIFFEPPIRIIKDRNTDMEEMSGASFIELSKRTVIPNRH